MATRTKLQQRELGELMTFGWQLRDFKKSGEEFVAIMFDADGEEQEVAVHDPIKPEPPTTEDTPEAASEKATAAAEQAKEVADEAAEEESSGGGDDS